jgi:hypothetical protein
MFLSSMDTHFHKCLFSDRCLFLMNILSVEITIMSKSFGLLPVLLAGFLGAPAFAQQDVVTFKGMCDASGAVPLDKNRFMVADDEDNVLRIYDALKGGDAVDTVVLTAEELGFQQLKKIHPKTGKLRNFELDIEAATEIDGTSFWITSHARNAKGKQKSERFQFIGLRRDAAQQDWNFVGKPYDGLIPAMIADARFAAYNLAQAAMKGAEEENGLNIEGMTARREGGVFIGFRNPVPQGKALVVALLNPHQIILGEKPQFLDPIELDLKGLGVRGLTSWHGNYLIAAGGATEQRETVLYRWSGGRDAPVPLSLRLPADFNPEAFFTPEDRSRFMVLSDDGAREVNGGTCKKLKDPGQKFFRGIWLTAG